MTKDFEWVGQGESVRHAAELMRDHDVGLLPIIEDDKVIGTLTDRDITVRGVAQGIDPETPVSRIMSAHVHATYADEEVEAAADLMQREQIRRVVVLNRDDHCVGIVSLGDLALRPQQRDLGGEVLEEVSKPGK
jgi:CBS domain-containing protein